MTETEWRACNMWTDLLDFFPAKSRQRKVRLLVCASCRAVWDFLGEPSRRAVEVAERYADAVNGTVERMEAESAARQAYRFATGQARAYAANAVVFAVQKHLDEFKPFFYAGVAFADAYDDAGLSREYDRRRTAFYHDLVGNPFHPVALDPSWRTEAVVALSEGIYEDRAFDRMPVLADALEDAGCSHEGIMSHCRGDGPHVKGCWVVDLLTGRQ